MYLCYNLQRNHRQPERLLSCPYPVQISEKTQKGDDCPFTPSLSFPVLHRHPCSHSWEIQLSLCFWLSVKILFRLLPCFLNLSLLYDTNVHLQLDNSQYRKAVCRAFHEVTKWILNLTSHCFTHYMHLQRAKTNLRSATVLCINLRLMKRDCS